MENDYIHSRRSTRRFLDKGIPRKMIEEILEAARVAPSAKNRQPWKFVVLGGESKKEMLRWMLLGLDREEYNSHTLPKASAGLLDARHTHKIMAEARVVIMVINTDGSSPFSTVYAEDRIREINNTLSIGAAIQNMLLKAEELGLGTLWIGNTCFAYPELESFLKTDGQLVGAVAVGYAAEKPIARPRKSLDEITEYRM